MNFTVNTVYKIILKSREQWVCSGSGSSFMEIKKAFDTA